MNAPSLPLFKNLPLDITLDGVGGYICGKLGQVNPELMATIFIMRGLAHSIFYQLANLVLNGKDLQSQKICLITSSAVNLSFLIVLRELNLIGRFFSCLFGLALIGYLINRVSYIEEKERKIYQHAEGYTEVNSKIGI